MSSAMHGERGGGGATLNFKPTGNDDCGYHEARTRHATWRMRAMAVVYRLDSQLGARRLWVGVNTVQASHPSQRPGRLLGSRQPE